MIYSEAVDWLFSAVPNFQRDGGTKNYKIGLEGPIALWELLEFPGKHIPTVHVAGTNGKGSSVHLIASGMKEMGLKVGVFSSPHLFDFRERAKIGTKTVPEAFVVNFVVEHQEDFNKGGYSFFELTLMLSLKWFESEKVDWIILETGMGGRLDATNICDPELCLITNIGMDHQQWLGTTRASIANEKAGIIKSGVPVVVVEQHEETREVFLNTAKEKGAPLFWAGHYDLKTDLQGAYQVANLNGAYEALHLLFPDEVKLWKLGFERVVQNTGFFGRWSVIKHDPLTVCDTGHNEHAFNTLVPQALSSCSGNVHWVLGSASDKDHDAFFKTLPKERSIYYWTGCSSPRCATGDHLAQKAAIAGLEGLSFMKVSEALIAAQQNATSNDLIFIGGSTFVIADLEL